MNSAFQYFWSTTTTVRHGFKRDKVTYLPEQHAAAPSLFQHIYSCESAGFKGSAQLTRPRRCNYAVVRLADRRLT